MTNEEIPEDLRITITNMRHQGYCVAGVRSWFKERSLDFTALLANGISARELYATGDAHAQRIVEAVIAHE